MKMVHTRTGKQIAKARSLLLAREDEVSGAQEEEGSAREDHEEGPARRHHVVLAHGFMIALHLHRLLRLSRSSAIAGWAVSSGSAAPATRAAVLASGAARGAGDGTKAGATKRAARASRTRGSALEPRAIFASKTTRAAPTRTLKVPQLQAFLASS